MVAAVRKREVAAADKGDEGRRASAATKKEAIEHCLISRQNPLCAHATKHYTEWTKRDYSCYENLIFKQILFGVREGLAFKFLVRRYTINLLTNLIEY